MSFVDNRRIFNIGANGGNPTVPSIINPTKCGSCGAKRPGETAIAPYTGWSSWKNNVSGNFNRTLCDTCKGVCEGKLPNAPGLYPINRVEVPPSQFARCPSDTRKRIPNPKNYTYLDDPGVVLGAPYRPFKYERGWWPDEYLNTFNEPDPLAHISLEDKIAYLRMLQAKRDPTAPKPTACQFDRQVVTNAGLYPGTWPRRDPWGAPVSKW